MTTKRNGRPEKPDHTGPVLVDTSVWSVAFRRKSGARSSSQESARLELERLVKANRAELLGVVRQELLSGLRERSHFDKLLHAFREYRDIPVEIEDYELAAEMHNLCRSNGISGQSVDFLICAVSARRGWRILSLDQDFQRYASRLPIEYYSGE